MNQLLSTLRLSAIFLAILSTAAHAAPGTITPEKDDTTQQKQNGDDGIIGEDDGSQDDQGQDDQDQGQDQNDQDQGQDQDDGYQDGQGQNDQGDNWGNDDQGDDQQDRGQNDGKDKGGKNQDDGYDRPGKPGRDQGKPGKPGYDKRHRRLVETVPVRQQYFGGARFPLYMLVNNLQRFEGYRLVGITINGSSDAGMGMAVFCGSQCGMMQNVGYYISSYPVQTTGERIGQYSAQWFLELRGNFWVDSIQLQFAR